MTPVTDLGLRRGLWRYRGDRIGLLGELGADQVALARSRLGRLQLLIVTGAAEAVEVLLERAADFSKSRALSRFARPLLGAGLLSAEGELHRRHRKLLAPGFQARRIGRYAADMVTETTAMLDRWSAGDERDLAHEIMTLTVRIAARTMFGDGEVPAESVGAALEIANRWVMDQASSILPLPLSVPTGDNRAMRAAVAELDQIVYDVIARKRARGLAGDADVLSMLLAAQDDVDGKGLTDLEVRDEVMTFFMAGHETTATALSWLVHALARAPQVAARATAEVDQVLAGRAPTQADLERLPLLRQVIQETMRLYPPAYMIGRQALVDTEVGGNPVGKGGYVLVNVFGLHRRADYHPDPLRLDPDRFAGGDSPAPRGGYIPFGLGPRVCIGNQFAMLEAGLVAATLLQRLDLASLADAEVVPEPLITLRPSPGLPMRVRWRR